MRIPQAVFVKGPAQVWLGGQWQAQGPLVGIVPRCGCFSLLLPQERQGSGVIGRVALDPLVNVAFRFGVADKNDAGRFHQAVGLGCK